jgi:hypothetical protein
MIPPIDVEVKPLEVVAAACRVPNFARLGQPQLRQCEQKNRVAALIRITNSESFGRTGSGMRP